MILKFRVPLRSPSIILVLAHSESSRIECARKCGKALKIKFCMKLFLNKQEQGRGYRGFGKCYPRPLMLNLLGFGFRGGVANLEKYICTRENNRVIDNGLGILIPKF